MTPELDEFKLNGIMRVRSFPRPQLDELVEYLKSCQVSNHHVFQHGSNVRIARDVLGDRNWPVMAHRDEDVRIAPHYMDFVEGFRCLAEDYFEGREKPSFLCSAHAFWMQPAGHDYPVTHDWHRDPPPRHQFTMFIFGTDVLKLEDGAHAYECGSHNTPDHNESYTGYKPTKMVETICGPAGTAFVVDTHGLHMGYRPNHSPRLLIVARWAPQGGH
jgi:hypothetical protein